LTLGIAPDEREIALNLGRLRPVDDAQGAATRLNRLNSGMPTKGPINGESLRTALRHLQRRERLAVSGELDDATRQVLVAHHGS
jgi:hypothetical protein